MLLFLKKLEQIDFYLNNNYIGSIGNIDEDFKCLEIEESVKSYYVKFFDKFSKLNFIIFFDNYKIKDL